jgi:predicted membrane-bound dolichyl-phosphate-mannose-protein mannosyltransferase
MKALVKHDSISRWLGTRKTLIIIPLAFLVARMALIPVIQPERPAMECIEPPYDGCGFAFDEAHYIPAVRKMLYRGEAVNLEHPPLSKLLIMAGIRLLGDNPWGWRVPGTLLSVLTVLFVGLIAYRVSRDVKLAMFSQTFAVTDVTFFNVSGLAILDPPFLTFTLISLYFLLERRMGLAGLFMGLAMLFKSSALVVLLAVVAVDTLHAYVKSHDLDAAISASRESVRRVGLPALAVFLVGIGIFDAATGAFPTPLHHLSFMLDYHSNLRYFDPRQVELPLSWIIPPISRGPAPYFVVTVEPIKVHTVAFWGVSSPLWWSIWLLIPLAYYRVKRYITMKERVENPDPHTALLAWSATSIGLFAFLAYILKRWVYSFYFLQVSLIMAALLPAVLKSEKHDTLLSVLLAAQIIWFIMFLPVKPLWLIETLTSLGLGEVPWV